MTAKPPATPEASPDPPADLVDRGGSRRRLGLVLVVGAAVATLDQGTKAWAASVLVDEPIRVLGGRLWLHESRNSGAAFSLGTGLTPMLTLIAAAAVITVVILARRPVRLRYALVLGLFLGGAAGNLSDRLLRAPGPFRGHVVDWIDFRVWPSFNLADSALVTACVLLAGFSLLARDSHLEDSPPAAPSADQTPAAGA